MGIESARCVLCHPVVELGIVRLDVDRHARKDDAGDREDALVVEVELIVGNGRTGGG